MANRWWAGVKLTLEITTINIKKIEFNSDCKKFVIPASFLLVQRIFSISSLNLMTRLSATFLSQTKYFFTESIGPYQWCQVKRDPIKFELEFSVQIQKVWSQLNWEFLKLVWDIRKLCVTLRIPHMLLLGFLRRYLFTIIPLYRGLKRHSLLFDTQNLISLGFRLMNLIFSLFFVS